VDSGNKTAVLFFLPEEGCQIDKNVRINEAIRAKEVRVVDPDGEQLGIKPVDEALDIAEEMDLDLVEVAPQAQPPVCKIMDFTRFKYEQEKKDREARKKQHIVHLKEIKMSSKIQEHDYQTKLGHIREFLGKGHKVKISLFFRGRENAHRDLGFQVIERVTKDCEPIATVESRPRLIGRGIFGVLSPIAPKPSK